MDHTVDLGLECLQLEGETPNNGHELLTPLTSVRWSTRTRGLRMGEHVGLAGEGTGWTAESVLSEHWKGPQQTDGYQSVRLWGREAIVGCVQSWKEVE